MDCSIMVDYDARLEDLFHMTKCDFWLWDEEMKLIKTKNVGKKLVEMRLYHFSSFGFFDGIPMRMYREGYRAAELHELLAFGAEYPNEQLGYQVIAFGSQFNVFPGQRWSSSVPCLLSNPPYRCREERRGLAIISQESLRPDERYKYLAVKR